MSGVSCKRNPHVLSPLFTSDESTSTNTRTNISESKGVSITALSISVSASARNNFFLFLSLQAQGKLLCSSNKKHPFQIPPGFTSALESMELANLSYLCSRILLTSRFVFTRHKCLLIALMLAFVLTSLVKTMCLTKPRLRENEINNSKIDARVLIRVKISKEK